MLLKEVYDTELRARGYYNFHLTASCYAFPWEYDGKNAYIILECDSNFVVVKAYSKQNDIMLKVYSDTTSSVIIDKAIKDAVFILGIKEDLNDFYAICKNDPLLYSLANDLLGIHMRAVQNLWQGLLISICQQNASFKQGWRMLWNIRKRLGEELRIPGCDRRFYAYPSPRRVIEKFERMRDCRVGYRAETILRAAKVFLKGEILELEDIKGIGQYSARLARILGLRKYDEFPVDRWFSTLIPRVYAGEEKWSIKETESFAKKKWGKWAGLAAVMITVVTGAKPLRNILSDIQHGNIRPLPDEPAPLTLWRYNLD